MIGELILFCRGEPKLQIKILKGIVEISKKIFAFIMIRDSAWYYRKDHEHLVETVLR